MGLSEDKEREERKEIWETIMTEIFLKLVSVTNHRTRRFREYQAWSIPIKLHPATSLSLKDTNIKKKYWKKPQHISLQKPCKGEDKGMKFLKCKRSKPPVQNYVPYKLSFKNEGGIKSFLVKLGLVKLGQKLG